MKEMSLLCAVWQNVFLFKVDVCWSEILEIMAYRRSVQSHRSAKIISFMGRMYIMPSAIFVLFHFVIMKHHCYERSCEAWFHATRETFI